MHRSLGRVLQSVAKQVQLGSAGPEFEVAATGRTSRIMHGYLGLLGWERTPNTCGMHSSHSHQQGEEGTGEAAAEAASSSQPSAWHRSQLKGGRPDREQHRQLHASQGLTNTNRCTLFVQLENMTNAGDSSGVRRTFDAALAAAQKQMAEGGKPPPSLTSPLNWRLYFLALEQTNAPAMFIGSRVHTMHDFGVAPQLQPYVILIKRCSESNMGNMAYSKVIEMKEMGLAPTMSCYLYGISACLSSQQPGFSKRLFEMVKDNKPECTGKQLTAYGKLSIFGIREFARWGRFSYCFDLMDDLKARGLNVPAFLLTDVMHLAALAGRAEALAECITRLTNVKQGFQVTEDPASKIVRPIKMDEGSLVEVLGVAAHKGDTALAGATWELLLRSLALPNAPNFPAHAYKEGMHEDENEEGALALDDVHSSAAEVALAGAPAPGLPAAQQQRREEDLALAAHVARAPQTASFHALIHAYANAHDFSRMFGAIQELQRAHPAAWESIAYYAGLQPVVDALAHSTRLIDDAYYLLEDMARAGLEVTPAMLNVVIAACSQVGDIKRGLETFDQWESLGVQPDADTYNALLQGCVECGMLGTMDKVLEEMRSQGVAANAHTHQLLVERYIVSADVAGMMEALGALEAAGHTPKTRLLERCVARCERAADLENMKLLLERLFSNDYRIVGIDAMTKRWHSEGGMAMLTGSSKWVNREDVVNDVHSSKGRYWQHSWHSSKDTRQHGHGQ